jgi:hypothetical protein
MSLLNIPTFPGQSLNGVYLGTRVQRGNPDQNGIIREKVLCGVSFEKSGPYGNTQELIEVVIPESLVKQGVPAKLAKFEQQEISLPYWEQVWSGSKGPGVTRYLSAEVTQIL